jgi:hypothetical protein
LIFEGDFYDILKRFLGRNVNFDSKEAAASRIGGKFGRTEATVGRADCDPKVS